MAGTLRVPRSRGAVSGALLVLLGAWGALVPFIGPYFSYAYTPATAWTYTSGRLWLSILPGAAALLGGLVLLITRIRPVGLAGGALAALGGAWFAVGPVLGPLWAGGAVSPGTPLGDTVSRTVEAIGFFTGLGVVIVFVAALALGRLSVVGLRDTRVPRPERPEPGVTPARVGAGAGAPASGTQATVPNSRPPAD